MAKVYWLKFGTGSPADTSGLAPTFTVFRSHTGGVVSPPGITQPIASYGLYQFEFSPSFPIVFVADGATTGLTNANRYLSGSLDPLDMVNERVDQVLALSNTLMIINVQQLSDLGTIITQTADLTVLGTTASSFGSTSVDPGNIMGYLKRIQENLEGDSNFNKTTGVWQIMTRGGTLLQEKTVTNAANAVTKT